MSQSITGAQTQSIKNRYGLFSRSCQHDFFRLVVLSDLKPALFSILETVSISLIPLLRAASAGALIAHKLGNPGDRDQICPPTSQTGRFMGDIPHETETQSRSRLPLSQAYDNRSPFAPWGRGGESSTLDV